MDGQEIDRFLESSLGLLSADVFSHPIWAHADIKEPIEAEKLAGALQLEATKLAAQEDWLTACRLLLTCAFLQNLAGHPQIAMEHLRNADQLARYGGLAAVVIWVGWGASALCAQAGDYPHASAYLLRLQQDLYNQNQWILANVIDLTRQSLVEWDSTGRRPAATAADPAGLLIDQLLCWGQPPAVMPNNRASAETVLRQPGWRSFWRTLLRFLRGELRLELVEVDGQDNTHAPAMIKMKETPLLLGLPPADDAAPPVKPEIFKEPAPPQQRMPPVFSSPNPPVEATPHHAETEQVSDGIRAATDDPGAIITGSHIALSTRQPEPRGRRSRLRAHSDAAETDQASLLKVCLLGRFRVELEGTVIDTWPSGRSKAVFAYLLAHHTYPVSREVLMETFWPETSIDSARNSLNVAVYNLRHILKTLCSSPIILLHESTAYQVNPNLRIWLDITVFEQAARDGRRCEGEGKIEDAVGAYQAAISLHQGDFLADTPFEGWTTMERERLRVLYLETLDHLSMLYFSQSQYADCIDLCQRIVSHDACREDAHSRLMRCYARQGQTHLSMRQFQSCVEALRDELDVPPSPAMVQLCEQIKRQEPV